MMPSYALLNVKISCERLALISLLVFFYVFYRKQS